MPRPIDPDDIIGKKFVYLKVNSYLEKVKKGRQTEHYYLCDCDCGATNVKVTRHCLLKGDTKSCGCLHKDAGKRATEDLSNQMFGRWLVLRQAERKISPSGKTRRTMWVCQCQCEKKTIKEVGARALKTGMSTSCGCVQKERVSQSITDDLTDKTFGLLKVRYRNGSHSYNNSSNRAVWHCECECGGECDATGESLKNGDIVSCGCKRISKYELYVSRYFEQLGYIKGIDFIPEKTYPDLIGTGGQLLRYDFLFHPHTSQPILIECQGEQHFKPVKWYGGEAYFNKLQIHDDMKREYATKNNIKLIEVPYTKISFEEIAEFLKSNGVY